MRELSLNVMDIVQNSLSAGAGLVEISVLEDQKADRLAIVVTDDGKGMTAEQVSHVIDPFYTTRTTRKVGLGVPLFKMEAEMTGGEFSIQSSPGVGTTVKAQFVPSSVDMIPLGDINATVGLLIKCNPARDFIFRREKDGQSFTLDTRELRAVLGEDVPLDTNEVTKWIEEYLKENTQLLFGGATER